MKKVFRIYMSVFLLGIILTACGGGGGGDGVLPADTSAPSVPTNLTASAVSGRQINLAWDASTDNVGVTGYKIYKEGTYVKSVPGNSASDINLITSTQYCYTVSAYDAAGNESSKSNEDCGTTLPSWTIQHGTASDDLARGIAVDGSGNIYVAGYTYGGLDGNSNANPTTDPLQFTRDIFVVKYAADGTKQWTKQLGTTDIDEAMGIAVDNSGNVYVTGYTYGDLVSIKNGGKDFFVVKLTQADGAIVWTQQLGTTADDWATGIALDTSGNIYVTGFTFGDLDVTGNQGGADLFVVKFNPADGTQIWTKQLGTEFDDWANGIALDSSDNIYVAGYTNGDLDGNTSAGGADVFVVKYDKNGAKQWTEQLGTADIDEAMGIAVDNSGNVYVTGNTYGNLDGSNQGDRDLFVVKLTQAAGGQVWARQLGTVDEDRANGIALDSSGNIYVTGFTYGGLDGNSNANPTTTPSEFTVDIIVVKYAADGTKQWTRELGTVENDWGMGIALDSSGGKIYATGGTCGNLDGNTSAGCSDFFVVQYAANGTKQ